MPQTHYLNRPKSSGKSLDEGFKFGQAPPRREIDLVGTRRRAGRDAALDTAARAKSASKRPEPPSTREMNIEPKTGERSLEQGALQPCTGATQNETKGNKTLDTSEAAIDELAQLEPLDGVASKSPPSTSPGVPNNFSDTPLPTMPDTPLEPDSAPSETCSSSTHIPVVRHNSVDQPSKTTTMTLEPIMEADGEDETSFDLSHMPTSRDKDFSMSEEQTAGRFLPTPGLPGEHASARNFAVRKEPNCALNPLAEKRPLNASKVKRPSQGTKRMDDSGTAHMHNSIHPGKDRYRVSKQSSGRQQSVPLPLRRSQAGGRPKQGPQDQFPSPEEVLQFLKFAVANESAELMAAQRAQFEEENGQDREKHQSELQEALARLTRVSTERDDLDARIKDHQAQLEEAQKAIEAVEEAKKEMEAQAASKTRALAAHEESIRDLQKQLGAARKKGNMAAMLEASCLPLMNGIDGIRSQLEALLQKEHQSKQDDSEILNGVRQIQTSAEQLPRVLNKAHTSLDRLTERIGSRVEMSGQKTLEFKESVSSLKDFFSTEIKAARKELSSQQKLQEQCTELRKENATLTERISGLQQEAADFKRQLEASSSSKTTLQQSVQERQRLSEERQRLSDLEASQTRLQADLDAVRSELQLKQGELESRSKSEKELQERIMDLEKQASPSSSEKLKMEYEKKLKDQKAQLSRDAKSNSQQQRAKYENRLREAEEEAKRMEEELSKVSGPNSTVDKLQDEIRELSRQLRAQEASTMSLNSEKTTSSVDLATLRSQVQEHQNELQKSREKALAVERGRQEIQSELEKTKEALEKATAFTPSFEDFERLEELKRQVLEAAEMERSLLKQLKDADENARNFVERGIAEGKDVWIMEHYEVEQEWKGSKARYEKEHEHLQAELYLNVERNRYLEKENQKLRQQVKENTNREAAHRINEETVPQQNTRERAESPMVGTPSPTSKSAGTRRMRKAADRSTNSIVSVEQSLVTTLAPSKLPQSPGQVDFQSTPNLDLRFFDQEQQVLVPRTAASTFVHDGANNDFFEQNGTQVVPASFPNWNTNENESIETTGVFSQAAVAHVGYPQTGDRSQSSHSVFEDFFTEFSNKEVSLTDKMPEPHTPRVGKSVAFREGRPRSRANTGRRLSQVASSDGQRTPLASKSRLAGYHQSPSVDREDEGESTPDFTKPIAKTGASHATPRAQPSRPSKRPASQTSTDHEIRKKVKTVEIISLDSQDTQESGAKSPVRSLSQSTHVSESQFQSQSQPQSQRLANLASRIKSSHGRVSMTGPPQAVIGRRRKSCSHMTDRFTQETNR